MCGRPIPSGLTLGIGLEDAIQRVEESLLGPALGVYRRYRELIQTGACGRLTEVVDERWIENCVGLTDGPWV